MLSYEGQHKVTKFVVMSTMRSGTTWLVSLLDSHPQITCAGEMLHSDPRLCDNISYHRDFSLGYYLQARPGTRSLAKRDQGQVVFEYLDWFYDSLGDTPALGFKLMLSHINRFPEVMGYVQERDIKVLLLLRHNLVDRLISHALFSTRERDHTTTVKEHITAFVRRYRFARMNDNGQVILNVRDCIRKLYAYESENAALLHYAATYPTEMVRYQDLVENRDACLRRIFAFLAVDPMEVASHQKRARTKPVRELVRNYDTFAKRLAGTRFEQFLI